MYETKKKPLTTVNQTDSVPLPTYVQQTTPVDEGLAPNQQALERSNGISKIDANDTGFEQENTQKYKPGEAFTSTQGLIIYSETGSFSIVDYNWFGYDAKVLTLSEKRNFTINVAETSFKEFSFDYFALHNSKTKVHFYDEAGNLIATVPLEYTGSPNKDNLNIKTLKFISPAGKAIGQVVIEVGDEPSVGDTGFNINNLRWSGEDALDITPLLQSMGKDSGSSASDLITNDGSAGRTVTGTLSRPLSADERLEFWNGSKWIASDVTLQRWSAVDDSTHSNSWQYKLRVVHAEKGAGQEYSFDITLDTAPSAGKVVFGAMTADDGSSATDWSTSDGRAGRQVSGRIDNAHDSRDVVQYSLDDGKTWLTLNVQSDSSWVFTDTSLHTDDWHYLVRIVDIAGNITQPVRQDVEFVLVKPEIINIYDNYRDKGYLTSPGFTDDKTPTLSGLGQPGTKVSIYNGTQLLGECSVNTAGKWGWTPAGALPLGQYDFHVVSSNGVKSSAASDSWPVTITTAPQITSLYDDAGSEQGIIVKGGSTDDTTPTLQGTAVAGSLVTFYEGNKVVGSVLASSEGNWTWSVADQFPNGLSFGTHIFTAKTPMGDGTDVESLSWSVKIIPPTPHATIEITSMSLDTGMSADDFITKDGSAGRTVNGTLSRSLKGLETVEVWNGNSWLKAEVKGKTWSIVDPETHTSNWQYKSRVAIGDGNYSPEAQRDIVLDQTALKPVISYLWDDVGDTGKVFGGGKTDDVRPTLHGSAEPGSVVKVMGTIYYEPWSYGVTGTTLADANGHWEWTPPRDLAVSKWKFKATMSDVAGNESGSSSEIHVFVENSINQSSAPDMEDSSSAFQSILVWHEDALLPQEEYSLDQLIVTGEQQSIALENLSFLNSVNSIDISGQGDNQLTLTAEDILQKGDEFLFISNGSTQLQINGDAGDVVNLKHLTGEDDLEGWHQSIGVVVSGGKDYSVWTHDSADIELLIESDIQVNI